MFSASTGAFLSKIVYQIQERVRFFVFVFSFFNICYGQLLPSFSGSKRNFFGILSINLKVPVISKPGPVPITNH